MNQLITTLAEDTAIATGAFAQSTVVPIDNEPTPRLIVEPSAGRAKRVSARRPSAHHGRRPAVAVGGHPAHTAR
jgi:hypothetical protein